MLKLGLGGLAGLTAFALAGCADAATPSTPPQGPVALQLDCWGSATRDKLTTQAMNLFHASNPAVTITSKFAGFTDYWPKLDAQIAKGNTPDLLQMDMRYLSEYVRRGLLLDLTQFIYNQTIDLSDFDPVMLDSSKANNTLYGVPLGGNYESMLYDTVLLDAAKVGLPPQDLTWDTLASYTTEITRALGNNVYGISDLSGDITGFELWVRQRGKDLYTRDGNWAVDLTDVADWYNYWSNLRNAGGCLPASLQIAFDQAGTPDNSPISKGKAVFNTGHSNQFEAYQQATHHPLAMNILPVGGAGSTPGMFLKPSMLISIAASTKYPTVSADFISFIINDINAVKVLGIERGSPGSARGLSALVPVLTAAQHTVIDYIDMVTHSGQARVKEVLDPPAAGDIATAMRNVAYDISLGHSSVTDGAKAFNTQGLKLIEKQQRF